MYSMVGIFAAYQMQLTNEAGDLDMHGDPRLLEFAASCRSRPCAEGEYSPYIPRRTFVPQNQNSWRQPVVNRVHACCDGVLELQYGHLPGLRLFLFFQSDVALIIVALQMGSGNSAKIIFIYCCLYMIKNSAGHRYCCSTQ